MGWNYLSIHKLHPTVYNICNYLSMLGLKLNHVSKGGHRCKQPSIKSSGSGRLEAAGQCVISLSWWQSGLDGWVMAEWLTRWPPLRVDTDVVEIQGPWFEIMLQPMKQFFHNRYYLAASAQKYFLMSPTCKITSYIYIYIYIYIYMDMWKELIEIVPKFLPVLSQTDHSWNWNNGNLHDGVIN